MRPVLAFVLVAGLAGPAAAQSRFLVADRTNNAIWLFDDLNSNGRIDEPGELWPYFNATNAAGTLNVDNPNAMAVRPDGLVAIGDQANQNITLLFDFNRDGDALDFGESMVAAGPGNASGISLSFPTGLAWDAGILYVVNAGNASGADAIYALLDLNSDGDFMEAGEIQPFVTTGAFGPTPNGPWAPQEIALIQSPVRTNGYLRNSSASLHGVYRYIDQDLNGRADDPGEFTVFWDATGASGVTPLAGFALERDAARVNAFYTLQTATGGIDQLVRLTDTNQDGDAQDADEAVIAYSTAEAGFTAVDAVSLADGRVLLTDNSGKKVYQLTDLDHDGLFTTAGERTVFLDNTALTIGDLRPMAVLPRVCQANCDGSIGAPVLNVNDFICFQSDFAAGSLSANCDSSTIPPVLNVNDFVCFQAAFASGCPGNR